MDEVDACVDLPIAATFLLHDSVIQMKKAAPTKQFSGLLLDVAETQGQCLPSITSLLKPKAKSGNQSRNQGLHLLPSRGASPTPSDVSDCDVPTEMLQSCEILDESFTESSDRDPGLPPVAPPARFESSMFYSKRKTNTCSDKKTPRRKAPVYRRCKNPELRERILQSCASLVPNSSEDDLKTAEKSKDIVSVDREEGAVVDENIPPSPTHSDCLSDSDSDVFDEDAENSSYYCYEATEGSDLSCQDMELDDSNENENILPVDDLRETTSVSPQDLDGMDIVGEDENKQSCNKRTKETKDGTASTEHGGVEKSKERIPLGDVTNQWVPISEESSVITSAIIPSQEADRELCNQSPLDPSKHCQFRFRNHFTTPISLRPCPLPSLDWAESKEVWMAMLKKDSLYPRDPHYLDRHPSLQSKMRSILLDWMTEVCEVYRLHRETYFLAVDFIDRYLTKNQNTVKQQLQLIGITALFIAAKAEEIYPPKLSDFAYVTDGACTEEEILQQELVMLKVLNWDLTPLTVNAWLNLYLQLLNLENLEDQEHGFIFPQYSAHAFVQIVTLLDLCILDIGSLQFTYSTIATTAISHMLSQNVALTLSGYQQMDISACYQWMLPFAMTVTEMGLMELRYFPNISPDDAHNIQMHNIGIDHLELAQSKALAMASQSRSSPDVGQLGVLTPPQSGKKCQENLV